MSANQAEAKCFKGINWGNVDFDEKNMFFVNKNKTIAKLPLKQFVNCSKNKNEIAIEFNTDGIKDE